MRGRVGDVLEVEEVARFQNRPVRLPDRLAWDIEALYRAMVDGVAGAGPADSLAIDSWAVDFGLVEADGTLVAPPRSYRDALTAGILPRLFERIPAADLYRLTGIQMLEINTLCQLIALEASDELAAADSLRMIPDLLRARLGGDRVTERTNASSTQMLGLDGEWSAEVLEACGIRPGLLPRVMQSTDFVGEVQMPGIPAIRLVAGASHDTAAAVAGTPLSSPADSVFISSGTWSLVGVELPAPVATPAALALNLSNEHGVFGTTRLLRNVMGLWLLQQCQRGWAQEDGRETSIEELVRGAQAASQLVSVFDPDDAALLRADDMPSAIRRALHDADQPAPGSRDALVRSILESLALRYRWAVDALSSVTGMRPGRIHVVGGGSANRLLCQMTASATGIPVIAGPVEATALGSIAVQAIAVGTLRDLAEARELIGRSVATVEYEPRDEVAWNDAYIRWRQALVP
jgi:rhamnulokinase